MRYSAPFSVITAISSTEIVLFALATALAGVVVKLRLWGNYHTSFATDLAYEEAWWRGDLSPMGLDETGFAYVMRDLERLAGESRA